MMQRHAESFAAILLTAVAHEELPKRRRPRGIDVRPSCTLQVESGKASNPMRPHQQACIYKLLLPERMDAISLCSASRALRSASTCQLSVFTSRFLHVNAAPLAPGPRRSCFVKGRLRPPVHLGLVRMADKHETNFAEVCSNLTGNPTRHARTELASAKCPQLHGSDCCAWHAGTEGAIKVTKL